MSSHPDADLHPVATGPAKSIVDAHAEEQPLKLYAGWFCPFVQRVWTVLEEKKIPYQYIEVNPYHKQQSLLDLNPRGLVPTLQYDNKPLFESTVVCEFLEDAYPERGPHLLPSDPYLKPMSDKEGLSAARKDFADQWKVLTKEMDPKGPFFFGEEPSLIDFVVAPWLVRLWIFDEYKEGLGIPKEGEGGEDEVTWARFWKWVRAIEQRPSVKNTLSDKEHYMPIYNRYHLNTAQSELAKATRSGRGVP